MTEQENPAEAKEAAPTAPLPEFDGAPTARLAESIGLYRPQLNWFLSHLLEAPQAVSMLIAMKDLPTVPERWAAFKPLGDMVFAGWFADFPMDVAAMPTSRQDVDALLEMYANKQHFAADHPLARLGDGKIAEGLGKLLPIIIQYLPLFLKMFGVPLPV